MNVLDLIVPLLPTNLLLFDTTHQDIVLRQQSQVPQLESHLEFEGLKTIVVVLCDLLLEHLVWYEICRLLGTISLEDGSLSLDGLD